MEIVKDEVMLKIAHESLKKKLDEKFHAEGGKKAIVICGGTGCLSSDSVEIKDKFLEIIKQEGLEDQISVNMVGCFGFCSQGPFVKVYPDDTLYRKVKVADVPALVKALFKLLSEVCGTLRHR